MEVRFKPTETWDEPFSSVINKVRVSGIKGIILYVPRIFWGLLVELREVGGGEGGVELQMIGFRNKKEAFAKVIM